MNRKNKLVNIIVLLVLLVCVLLPDVINNTIMGSHRVFWNWLAFLYIVLLCSGLTFLKKIPFTIIWTLFCLLEITQFVHIAYFGVPIFPSAVMAIFYEYRDIFVASYIKHVWFVVPVLLTVYGCGLVLFYKLAKFKKDSKALSFCLIIFSLSLIVSDGLIVRPFRMAEVLNKEPYWLFHRCLMKAPSPSLRSTIFTLSCTGLQSFVFTDNKTTYRPYKISKIPSQVKNIVLIMGESFSSQHMSLFGYKRKTTPNLDALSNNPAFIFKPSYAAAPSTKTSIMLFFNVIREPGNLTPIETGENNLFRRAKLNGFKTFLITNNDGSRGIGPDIDDVRSSIFLDNYSTASHPKILRDLKDGAFPQILKELPLSNKNFIVLHMRSPHSPFEQNYEHDKARFGVYPNTYDNCVLYLDSVFKEIINSFKETFKNKGESYLIFTSDHGELFGEKDKTTGAEMFGHGHLTLSCAAVPFWAYAINNQDQTLYNSIRKTPLIAAYQIGKLILNMMGEKQENPNQTDNTFYVTENLLKKDRANFITYKN
jgi:glucan phosphoethanolaminetransferase (alkaline phosphatase superfamily)